LSSAKKELKRVDSSAQKLIKKKLITLVENPDLLKNNIKALIMSDVGYKQEKSPLPYSGKSSLIKTLIAYANYFFAK